MYLYSFGIKTLGVGIWECVYCYFSTLPKVAYLLANSFLTLLDIFQLLFRKLAGLDGYYVDGVYNEGDIVYRFLSATVTGEYPFLTNVFWGLIILGFILLFLSTFIAVIRNEYTAEKADNSKKTIISKAFKSLAYFAIVPIVCLFGVYLSNIVLQAVDKATTGSGENTLILLDKSYLDKYEKENGESTYVAYNFFGINVGASTTPFSGVVFKAAAYNANRVRAVEGATLNYQGTEVGDFTFFLNNNYATNFGGFFMGDDTELLAEKIDEAFANTVILRTDYQQKLLYSQGYIEDNNVQFVDIFGKFQQEITIGSFDRFNVTLVWYYYDLWQYNFLVAFGAGIIMITIFMNIILGLMKRIVELFGLFLISAPLIALMPLDGEKAYGGWRSAFISKTLMAFGAVAGMNILFLILPYLNQIEFFNITPIDRIISAIILIVGLISVKSFISMISGFVGGENANDVGSAIAGEVGGTIAKAGLMTAGALATGGIATGAALKLGGKAIAAGVKGAGGAAKGIGKGIYQTATAKKKAMEATAKDKEDFFAQNENSFGVRYDADDSARKRFDENIKNEWRNDPSTPEQFRDEESLNNRLFHHRFSDEYKKQYNEYKTTDTYKADVDSYKQARLESDYASSGIKAHQASEFRPHPIQAIRNIDMGTVASKAFSPVTATVRTIVPPITKNIKDIADVGFKDFKGDGFVKGLTSNINANRVTQSLLGNGKLADIVTTRMSKSKNP